MLSEAFFWMPKAQKHCKLHDFYAWTVPKNYEKFAKIDPKTPNKDLQNASSNFTLFFPTPNPQKRENPSRLKDFRGGSAAGARPRVAKAMLSCHHYTARHRRIKRLRATAGQGPNYVGPLCGYVGLCWRMLAYLAGNVGPSCGYVGLCWPHVDHC